MSVEDDRLRPTRLAPELRLSEIVSPVGGLRPLPANSGPQQATSSIKYISQRSGYVALILNAAFFAYISYWLYQNIEFADLSQELKQIPLSAILTAMTMNVFVLLFYGSRLSTLLGGGLLSGFLIATMGFTFNSLVPFRAGEGVKIYFGHSYYNYAIGGISAAVLLEKLYDVTAIVTFVVAHPGELRFAHHRSAPVDRSRRDHFDCFLRHVRLPAESRRLAPSGLAHRGRLATGRIFQTGRRIGRPSSRRENGVLHGLDMDDQCLPGLRRLQNAAA